MKVKIIGNDDAKKRIKEEIQNIEFVSEGEEYMLIPSIENKKPIIGKIGEDIYILKPTDIIYFESDGNDVIAKTSSKEYYVKDKIYQLEGILSEFGFLRISRFHVVNMAMIKSLKPTDNLRFELTMNNKDKVFVTRSYYYIFKEYIGI